MVLDRFFARAVNRRLIERLYARIVAAARRPVLYTSCGVADTFEGRGEMLILHLALVVRAIEALPPPAGDVARDLIDHHFRSLDGMLREMGTGDMGVPKRIKRMAEAFYGRSRVYAGALAAGDTKALSAALSRNVLDGGDATRLVAVVTAARDRLDGLDLEALLAGAAPFDDTLPATT
jgi:cytochrome b pre-mRNA-processing protein 3